MAYYRGDYYEGDYYQGFPFIAGAVAVGKRLLPKVGAAIGRTVGGKGKRILKTGVGIATGGAIFEGGAQLGKRVFGGGEERRQYRRMNVANVRALRRAIRRARGFAKLARSVMTFPITKPPKGRAMFKAKRRSR